MEIVKVLSVLWKVPRSKKRPSYKNRAPAVIWRHEWMKTRDFDFFGRKIYLTISIGYIRGRKKPIEHRQSLKQKLLD